MTRRVLDAKKGLAIIFAIALAILMVGCSSNSSSTESSNQTQEEKILEINKIEGDSFSFKVANDAGKDVKSLSIKKTDVAEWGTSVLGSSVWTSGEKAKLYFAKDSQVASTADGQQVAVKTTYDVQIVFSDDATYILHSVPIETLNGADSGHLKINAEYNLAYIEFDGDSGYNSFKTTLDNDRQVQSNEIAAAEAAKKAEEEAAAASAAAAAAQSQSNSNSSSSSSSSSSSGGTSRNSGGSSQSQNDCTGGFVTK